MFAWILSLFCERFHSERWRLLDSFTDADGTVEEYWCEKCKALRWREW